MEICFLSVAFVADMGLGFFIRDDRRRQVTDGLDDDKADYEA